MKVIGMLGGMSWESTQTYYRAVNEGVKQALGGLHSAQILLYSVNFAEIERLQHEGRWDELAEMLSQAARSLEAGGADFLLICTNTMHKLAPQIAASIGIPILHLADATAVALQEDGVRCVGLLGTRFTMEQDFYRQRLEAEGIQVVVPDAEDRERVHQVIYTELCRGVIKSVSRQAYLSVIHRLTLQQAEAVILGCTEIGMLVRQSDTLVPLYDTTLIHAQQAVKMALE
ncbi:Aspartate racemase [Nitrincola lacisaponensis]|uniref:Aspartate racemase n=1 Tax=Nitrincola lacisaponensis TaxID=267850 RepID=A0A063Y2W7_9GAMM|nr:aspartate/glutamate racemase family protein [Nitrincola lacisaponensis]KDE40009.1 Aspartate racemase [Nitrincola lacisaponensis]